MSNIAVSCTDDIAAKVKTVDLFKDKTFSVLSEEDLIQQGKLLKPPFAGIMYEGIIAVGGDPTRQGLSTEVRVTVALGMAGRTIGNLNTRNDAAENLDAIRKEIMGKTSPTGHKWRFQMEVPAGTIGGHAVYLQRWATMLPNVPVNS